MGSYQLRDHFETVEQHSYIRICRQYETRTDRTYYKIHKMYDLTSLKQGGLSRGLLVREHKLDKLSDIVIYLNFEDKT